MEMNWISSSGGPLVVLNRSDLCRWKGFLCEDSGQSSDYDRACRVDDYIGLVGFADDRTALVLGDEPLQTTWINLNAGGMLVRWWCADDEASLLAHARKIAPISFRDDQLRFDVDQSGLQLFDAAIPGAEVQPDDVLKIDLPSGRYRLATSIVTPDK